MLDWLDWDYAVGNSRRRKRASSWGALQHYEEALRLLKPVAPALPSIAYGKALVGYAYTLLHLGRLVPAIEVSAGSLRLLERMAAPGPPVGPSQRAVHDALGRAYVTTGVITRQLAEDICRQKGDDAALFQYAAAFHYFVRASREFAVTDREWQAILGREASFVQFRQRLAQWRSTGRVGDSNLLEPVHVLQHVLHSLLPKDLSVGFRHLGQMYTSLAEEGIEDETPWELDLPVSSFPSLRGSVRRAYVASPRRTTARSLSRISRASANAAAI